MNINIFTPLDDASKIEGFTVVVDVFRAFSTAYYIWNNNPKQYILTNSIEHSKNRRLLDKNVILIGEREGVKLEGFDYGNSPAEIQGRDFSSNIIVHTTSKGTKGVIAQPLENQVVVGSFVNIQAIINYIHKNQIDNVNIYCTANRNDLYGGEDYIFADYLRSRLKKESCSFENIVTNLRKGSGKVFVDELFAPYSDFLMCMDINRFDFILKRKIHNDVVELVKL